MAFHSRGDGSSRGWMIGQRRAREKAAVKVDAKALVHAGPRAATRDEVGSAMVGAVLERARAKDRAAGLAIGRAVLGPQAETETAAPIDGRVATMLGPVAEVDSGTAPMRVEYRAPRTNGRSGPTGQIGYV